MLPSPPVLAVLLHFVPSGVWPRTGVTVAPSPFGAFAPKRYFFFFFFPFLLLIFLEIKDRTRKR
jgi:hypothetical protein